MPNIAQVLKEEIQRLAQRDAKLSAADRKGQVLHLDFQRGSNGGPPGPPLPKARDRSPAGNHGQMQLAGANMM